MSSPSSTQCNIILSIGFCLLAHTVLLASSQNPSPDNVIVVADLPISAAAAGGQNVNFLLDRLLEGALEIPVAGDGSAQQTDVNVNAVQRNGLIAAAGTHQIPAPTQLVKAVMNSGLRR